MHRTFKIDVKMNGVSSGGQLNLHLDGYSPIALAGFENGSNTATFIQRCEIEGETLKYNVRTTSNTSSTATVYFDATILYKMN